MSDFKLSDATQRKLDNAAESFAYNLRRVTFADPRPARLGNGEQPATVVIPPAKRRDGCTLYAYFEVDQTREVIQIANTNAGITFDNSNAGLPVLIAKPFGSTVYHIVSFDPNSLNDVSGGILPAQAMQKYGFILTPDRWQDLQPVPQGDMTVGITAGIVMINHMLYPILATDNFSGDLTSYIPATAGMSKWVIVEYDGSAVSILEGSEFVPSGLSNSDALPTSLSEGKEPLFAVYLFNGQTAVEKRQLLPLKTFHKSFASSLIGLSDTPSAYGTAGQVLQVNAGADGLEFGAGGASTDELVAVSANDTTPGYLLGKLTAGTGITLTEVNDGADEDVSVAVDASAIDLTDLGSAAFTDLDDTPSAYTSQGGKYVRVNVGETALEFNTLAGGGDLLADGTVPMTADFNLDDNSILSTELASDPSTPASGKWKVYTKSNGLNIIDDAGTVTNLSSGGGGGGTVSLNARYLLQETLLVSTAASFDLSSIPTTYDSLEIEAVLRCDRAADDDSALLFFNNDTTQTNYRSMRVFGGNSATHDKQSYPSMAPTPASNADANAFGYTKIIIPFYHEGTRRRGAIVNGFYMVKSTFATSWNIGIDWNSTAAINRITISLFFGSNFVAGSRVKIYGTKEVTVSIP